jgi:hypothetical protein
VHETLEGLVVKEYVREIGDLDAEEKSEITGEDDQNAECGESEFEDEMQEEDDYDHMSLTSNHGDLGERDEDEDLTGLDGIEVDDVDDGGDSNRSEDGT